MLHCDVWRDGDYGSIVIGLQESYRVVDNFDTILKQCLLVSVRIRRILGEAISGDVEVIYQGEHKGMLVGGIRSTILAMTSGCLGCNRCICKGDDFVDRKVRFRFQQFTKLLALGGCFPRVDGSPEYSSVSS